MKALIISHEELSYLRRKNFLPQYLLEVLNQSQEIVNSRNYKLLISEDIMDDIRNCCGEQLQLVGFDEDYNLTRAGKILEQLIDKLYVG